MSQKKIFRCQDCGYETEVYEGRGFMGQHIEAMSCPDCRNIVPLVVGVVLTGFTGGICILAQSAGARCNPLAKKSFGHENSSLYLPL